MALTGYNDLVTSLLPPNPILKAAFTGQAAGQQHSSLYLAGLPGAAVAPTPGLAGAALTAYAGQLSFPATSGSTTIYLAQMSVTEAANVGAIILCDRLWHNSGITSTTTTGQTVNSVAWPARDVNGAVTGVGLMLGLEVTTATTNGAPITNTTVTYCVDPLTECLTKRGWLRYNALTLGDELLAFDLTSGHTRWERPQEIFVEPDYRGEMVLLSSRQLSALTTPNHRWPVDRVRRLNRSGVRRDRMVEVCQTSDLPHNEWSLFASAGHDAPTTATYSDAFVRIIAWYMTEGSLKNSGTGVNLCQSIVANPVHVEDIRRDLKEIGAAVWSERTCVVDNCVGAVTARKMCKRHYHHWWTGETKRAGLLGATPGKTQRSGLWVHEYLRRGEIVSWDLTGDGVKAITDCAPGKSKVPTMAFLSALTADQLRVFVDTCIAGDGTPEKRHFFQHHEGRMSAFMAAAVLAGFGPTLDKTGTTCSVGVSDRRITLPSVRRQSIAYVGAVWCPVTESGHWVARRNGKVFITGNTNTAAAGSKTATIASFPANAVAGTFVPFAYAAGDVGLTSIQTLTLGTSYGTGVLSLVVYRPIAMIPCNTANIATAMDWTQLGLPVMYNTSVPWMVYVLSGTAGGIVTASMTYAQK